MCQGYCQSGQVAKFAKEHVRRTPILNFLVLRRVIIFLIYDFLFLLLVSQYLFSVMIAIIVIICALKILFICSLQLYDMSH